jgi:hypothetical protein
MATLGHLIKRFFGSLWPLGPRPTDSQWAEALLLPGELDLWRRMSSADRRHAIGVARRVADALSRQSPSDGAGERAPVSRPVLAAALVHDVGKIDARLGAYGRAVATVAGRLGGPSAPQAWSRTTGLTRRVGLYLRHAPLGADRLRMAGSDPLTVAWTAEHHLPPEEWTVSPPEVAWALKRADDD